MYDIGKDKVSTEFIESGRRIAEVFRKYKLYCKGAENVAELAEINAKDPAERMLACAVYRVYALGFEDALNAGKKG